MSTPTETIHQRAFDIRQTAEILNVSPTTVRRLVGRKLIKPMPYFRHLKFTDMEIDRFLKQSTMSK